MTLSLSKLMAVADKATDGPYWTNTVYVSTFDPPTVKRLLAIAKAALEFIDKGDKGRGSVEYVNNIRASLEGVEL